jgi:hypothetical protein
LEQCFKVKHEEKIMKRSEKSENDEVDVFEIDG